MLMVRGFHTIHLVAERIHAAGTDAAISCRRGHSPLPASAPVASQSSAEDREATVDGTLAGQAGPAPSGASAAIAGPAAPRHAAASGGASAANSPATPRSAAAPSGANPANSRDASSGPHASNSSAAQLSGHEDHSAGAGAESRRPAGCILCVGAATGAADPRHQPLMPAALPAKGCCTS